MGEAFLTGFTWLLLGMLMSIPTMKVLHYWMVEKTWGGGTALMVLLGMFAILGVTWCSAGTTAAFIFTALLLLATGLMPAVAQRTERRALKEMRDEDIRRYQNTLRFDPSNTAAHAFLGEAYLEREQYDEAIAEFEQAVALEMHQADAHTYRYKLQRAQAARDGATRKPIIVCEHCHFDSPADLPNCRRCGKPLRLGFFAWLLQPGNGKTILKQSAVATGIILLLGVTFSSLSLEVKGCVIIAATIVAGFLLLKKMGE